VEPWQLRDLRRTAATGIARLGYSDELVGRILGHARKGVTSRVYQKDVRLEERRKALAHWALRVERLDPANDPFSVAAVPLRPTPKSEGEPPPDSEPAT